MSETDTEYLARHGITRTSPEGAEWMADRMRETEGQGEWGDLEPDDLPGPAIWIAIVLGAGVWGYMILWGIAEIVEMIAT